MFEIAIGASRAAMAGLANYQKTVINRRLIGK